MEQQAGTAVQNTSSVEQQQQQHQALFVALHDDLHIHGVVRCMAMREFPMLLKLTMVVWIDFPEEYATREVSAALVASDFWLLFESLFDRKPSAAEAVK